jgi:hypothetical protein
MRPPSARRGRLKPSDSVLPADPMAAHAFWPPSSLWAGRQARWQNVSFWPLLSHFPRLYAYPPPWERVRLHSI